MNTLTARSAGHRDSRQPLVAHALRSGRSGNVGTTAARTFVASGTIPEELTSRNRWICWKYKADGGKLPVTPNGRALPRWQKDEAQWMSYESAVDAYNANPVLAGIGFVLSADLGIVGLDMDHVIETTTGEIAEWALEHVAEFDTYTEVSPSGAGFRMFTLGALPDGCPKKAGHREIYDGGRWLTVTGNVWNDVPIAARPEAVARYVQAMKTGQAPPQHERGAVAAGRSSNQALVRDILAGINLHDATMKLVHRYIDDGMEPGKVVDTVRGLMEAMPVKGDEDRWRARYEDIPRLVHGAEVKLAKAASNSALAVVEVGDLMRATVRSPEFVIEQLIPRRHVTLLGGHGGSGKSTLALAFAAHVACGSAWAGLAVQRGPVAFVTLEDEPDLVRHRLRNVVSAYGLDSNAVTGNLRILDGATSDASLAIERSMREGERLARTPAMEGLTHQAQGCVLIVVDNASDGYEANANDPTLVRTFVRRMLGRIARDTDAAVLLLAHIDKDAARNGARGNAYIGSTAWHNSARSRLALIERDGGALDLMHEKSNLSRRADPISLQRSERGVPIPLAGGVENPMHDLTAEADANAVIAAMEAAAKAEQDVYASRVGNYTAQRTLQTFAALPKVLHDKRGRERFLRAIDRLLGDGKVKVETHRTEGRKFRRRLVLAGPPKCA